MGIAYRARFNGHKIDNGKQGAVYSIRFCCDNWAKMDWDLLAFVGRLQRGKEQGNNRGKDYGNRIEKIDLAMICYGWGAVPYFNKNSNKETLTVF